MRRSLPALFLLLLLTACAPTPVKARKTPAPLPATTQRVVLAGGCFWCMEAVFQRVQGVLQVTSGYCGGTVANPDYHTVCTGTTGHAEAVDLRFDPAQISLHDLLEIFFAVHDPTSLNRQGADAGTQYRSAIFWTTPEQQSQAQAFLAEQKSHFSAPIVTELKPLQAFYPAEDYHQDYFRKNPNQPYCAVVVSPKVQKLLQKFPKRVKQD